MAIKFTCPHCNRTITVKDTMAGKKGPCPGCHHSITVPDAAPAPASTSAPTPAASEPPPAPTPANVDVEAEAAALFGDNPQAEAAEPKTIDFPCPFCDEMLHLDAALAGKKASCPACRRIVKVPELVQNSLKDWTKAAKQLPSGAKRPDEPALEGAWGSTNATKVSAQTMAEVAPKVRVRLTRGQKVKRGVLWVGGAGILTLGVFLVLGWFSRNREQQAFKTALDYATSDGAANQVGREGQAVLHMGAGEYYLRTKKREDPPRARDQFAKAFSLLANAPAGAASEREAVLADLALAQVEIGGPQAEVDQHLRLSWDEAQKAVRSTLAAMTVPEARLEALRAVSRRLIARGQPQRVMTLAAQVYSAPPVDVAEALAVVGMELFIAGHKADAEKVAEKALAVYAVQEERPPLRASVVALAVALKRPSPKPGKGALEDENDVVGQAEGLARGGNLEQARRKVEAGTNARVRLRALVGVAAAALDRSSGETTDLEVALKLAPELQNQKDVIWPLVRLAQLAVRAGFTDEVCQPVIAILPDRALKARVYLALLQARLAASKQVVEESVLDKIDSKTLAFLLAGEALARHNVRYDGGWAKIVQNWDEPRRFFGLMGVALGMQGGDGRTPGLTAGVRQGLALSPRG